MFSPIYLVSASRTDGGGKEIIVVIQERSDGESKPGERMLRGGLEGGQESISQKLSLTPIREGQETNMVGCNQQTRDEIK